MTVHDEFSEILSLSRNSSRIHSKSSSRWRRSETPGLTPAWEKKISAGETRPQVIKEATMAVRDSVYQLALMPATSVDQHIDGLARIRAAIDIVAEEHVEGSHWLGPRKMKIDRSKNVRKQVGTSMNVADGIDTESIQ
jgi:hypothetical protein